ncbi:MAG: aminotransferase class V-fold PLP-dependent enzyme [Alphaproteobacteria bacterium]|nr:aminotransferase class V-fold PLP-dependent enzyme [Alphaproteobacteria bacterium]
MDFAAARALFPLIEKRAYLNTSAVAPASVRLADGYRRFVERWTEEGFDFPAAESSGDRARAAVARLLGCAADDVAQMAAISAAAEFIAAQFLPARPGENIVVGAGEFSSNQFPWRQLERRGYAVRLVEFRDGGVAAEDVAAAVDGGTRLIAASAVQAASGHRSDLGALSSIARGVGAWFFVDGTQAVGALDLSDALPGIDFLATTDHKFLLNAARGMGYLYIRPALRAKLVPFGAGWKSGRNRYDSYFGPQMDLADTAARFDGAISWMAAAGDEICLALIEEIGPARIYARNAELADMLRETLAGRGHPPVRLAKENRSHVVAVPLGGRDPAAVLGGLREKGVVCAARDGNLRISVNFYNDESDIERLAAALG